MNILFVTDEKFAEICTVAMRSVALNNDYVHFYVVQDNVNESTKSKMKKSLEKLHCEVTFITAENIENKFNVNVHSGIWPMTCLQRLFLCDYLPVEMNKVLYLDCDIIVRKSLQDLYNVEFENGEYCAAVPDCVSDICRQNIGISKSSDYYNSGVLLINLDLWRKDDVANKFVAIMSENEGKLQYPDQDIINIAFENKIKKLNAKYNVTSYEYAYTYDELMFYHNANYYIEKTEYENAISDPCIFHFTNDMLLMRPWIKGNNHPLFLEWIAIRNNTAWGNDELWINNEKWIAKFKRYFAISFPKNIVLRYAKHLNKKHSSRYSK